MENRERNIKYNIVFSLISQAISLVCGFVVPQLFLKYYGSEAYGATTSITQFLGYITLLEGGIAGVARAALYKPLSQKDYLGISKVINEIQRFFRHIAYFFVVYVIILACSYKQISNIQCFDWISSCALVVVISLSTFAQYFIGISYNVLLQAAQKTYVTQLISISTTVLNTLVVVILVKLNFNIIVVKLFSSFVFILRPIASWLYAKKHYRIIKVEEREEGLLAQKWTGLGQHIAYFLHSNTDVVVLTLFVDLASVAIYSVYNLIITQVQSIASSFTMGMEALFGDMLAKKEEFLLKKTFSTFETLIHITSTILFSATMVLIVPFVTIYTRDIGDANYVQPLFSFVLLLCAILTCLRIPYHSLVIASGRFRETSIAAYGEACINICLSIILVNRLGLIGVAIGTLAAVSFRFAYYVYYISIHLIYRSISKFVRRIVITIVNYVVIYCIVQIVSPHFAVLDFVSWSVFGGIVLIISTIVTMLGNCLFYMDDVKSIIFKLAKS